MDSARLEVTKLPRCPRGTRRNRITGKCEKTDSKRHTRRLTIVDVLPAQVEPEGTIRAKRKTKKGLTKSVGGSKSEAIPKKTLTPNEASYNC